MNTCLARLFIVAALVVFTSRVALSAEPFGLPDLNELKRAGATIPYYVVSVRPWWTCKFEWTESRRQPNTIVYKITFPGDQKCSKSKRTEVFDLFYNPRLDKVIKMVPVTK